MSAVEAHNYGLLIVLTLCDADCAFGLQALAQLQIMHVRAGAFVSFQLEGSVENSLKDFGSDGCHIYAPAAYAHELVNFSILEEENIEWSHSSTLLRVCGAITGLGNQNKICNFFWVIKLC